MIQIILSAIRQKNLFIIFFSVCVIFMLSCEKDKTLQNNNSGENKASDQKDSGIEIKGQVKLADSQDNEGIIVYVAGTTLSARTDSAGNFSFSKIEPGSYQFIAEKNGYQSEKFIPITIEKEQTKEETQIQLETLILQPIPKEIYIAELSNYTGHVALEGETKHEGIKVFIKGVNSRTVSDELGEYSFQNLNPGTYTFIFTYDKFKTEEYSQQLEPGENVQLKELITLKRVDFPDKERNVSGSIEIYDLNGNIMNNFNEVIVALEGTSFIGTPDSSGKFTISGMPAGNYTITASALGFVNRSKIDIDLNSNNTANVTLILDQKKEESGLGTLMGNVRLSDQSIDASNISVALVGTSFVGVPNTNGEFTLSKIPEGTYSFIAKADGFNSIKVDNIEITSDENTNLGNLTLEKKIEPPIILATEPSDGQSDVIIRSDVPVTVRFSKKMKPDTVKSAFSIAPRVDFKAYMGRENPQSDFDLLYVVLSGNSPQNSLKFKTEYKVTINTSAQDVEGANLEDSYVFKFKTVTASIIKTFPEMNDRNAFLNEANPAIVFFNTKIQYETFKENNITISPLPRSTFRTYFRDDPNSGWTEAYIYTTWEFDKSYTITLGRGIRTSNGEPLSNTPYKWKFKTTKMVEAQPGFER